MTERQGPPFDPGRAQHAAPDFLPYVRDPNWIPESYDSRADTLSLVRLPRDMQRRMVFLDPRFTQNAEKLAPAPISQLPHDAIREAAGPIHFIFHTSFCCSTLLVRALDIPGTSMGMKEPNVLSTFADQSNIIAPGVLPALSATLDLLSRPFEEGESQIVKPSNIANHIIAQVMHIRPDAKVLLLYSNLETFLRAIARRGEQGRSFGRTLFQHFLRAMPQSKAFSAEELMLQTDLQISAHAWMMQASMFRGLAQRYGANRVRTLNSDTLLANVPLTLEKVGAFFGLKPQDWEIIANGPVFQEHAKEHGRPFDANAYKAQFDQAGFSHANELRMALNWAAQLAQHCNYPLTLGDTLFD